MYVCVHVHHQLWGSYVPTHSQHSYVEKEQSLQAELDKLRTNLAQLEQSKKMKENAAREQRAKVKEIARELTSLGSGGAALEGVEQELRSAVSDRYSVHVYMQRLP